VAERVIGGLTVRIDESLCVGFGDCVERAAGAFLLNGSGTVEFVEPPSAEREALLDACRTCPVDALTVLDESGNQVVP
jgi:ferredoxin